MRRAIVPFVVVALVLVGLIASRGCDDDARAPADLPRVDSPASPTTGAASDVPARRAEVPAAAGTTTPAPSRAAPLSPEDPRAVEARGTVRGVVRDADGRPVEGARVGCVAGHVVAFGVDEPVDYQYFHFAPHLATTDAGGRYEIGRVPMGGAYQIGAESARHGATARVRVFVADETPVVAPDLAFVRRASLTVTILGPDGRRVDEADLSIETWRGSGAPTRVSGVHRVDPIDPRGWTVVASKAPFGCAFERVEIAPGAEAAVTLRLSDRGETLTGVVVDDAGAPIAGASVRACEADRIGAGFETEERDAYVEGCSDGRATTDADGRFRVQGLRRGEHDVVVAAEGRRDAREWKRMVPSADARYVLERYATATLRLVPSGGAPLPAELALRTVLAPVRSGRYIESGAVVRDWKAPWNDGVARFTEVLGGPGSVRAHAAGFVPVERTIDPKPGDVLDLGEAALAPSLVLTGRVVDPDGRPIAGATVFRHDRTAAATTDERGVFRLVDQPPGDVGVHAAAHGFGGADATGASGGDAAAFTVTLPRAAVFRGRVLDAKGGPVAGFEIALFTSPVGPRQPCAGDCFTDHRGVFDAVLAPGKYRLGDGGDARTLSAPQGEEVELKAGETTWIVLRR